MKLFRFFIVLVLSYVMITPGNYRAYASEALSFRKEINVSATNSWSDQSIEASAAIPLDSAVKYHGRDTSRIRFTSDSPGGIGVFLLQEELSWLAEFQDTAFLSVTMRGDYSQSIDVALQSGLYNSDPLLNTEQVSCVKINNISAEWNTYRIDISEFIENNGNIDFSDIRSVQIRDNDGGKAGAAFWTADFTFSAGIEFEEADRIQKYSIHTSEHSTWCSGDIVRQPDDSMIIDYQTVYNDNGFEKPSGKLEFTSDDKGFVRILGLDFIKLADCVDTAYFDMMIKGNEAAQSIDISLVSDGGQAGSWGIISGVTTQWQMKRVYLRDLLVYMGTADYNNIYYMDLYKENGAGSIFWIGDINFYTAEEPDLPQALSLSTDSLTSWLNASIEKNYVPIDYQNKYNANASARLTFPQTVSDYNIMFFTDPAALMMADYSDTGCLEVPVKGNGVSDTIQIALVSGIWNSDPNYNTEQISRITLSDITDEWQVYKIPLASFLRANPSLELNNITSVRINGSAGALQNATFWFGDISFVSVDKGEAYIKNLPTDDILSNPGMGWVLLDTALPGYNDAGYSGQYPLVDNVSIMTTWGMLEPQEGVYDWTILDETIDYWTNQGKKIDLRISTEDFPYYGKRLPGCPDWAYDAGVPYQTLVYPLENINLKFPKIDDSIYKAKLTSFMTALADRYKNNPAVEIVGLRGYGLWGEWHSGYRFNTWTERCEALKGIIDIWRNAWQGNKKLSINYSHEWLSNTLDGFVPSNYNEFIQYSAFDYAMQFEDIIFEREGVYGAMEPFEWQLNNDTFISGKEQIAELNSGYSSLRENQLIDGIDHPSMALDEALKLHPNYITVFGWDKQGSAAQFYAERPDLVQYGISNMGYRLYPYSSTYKPAVQGGETINITQVWRNLAAGACFEDAFIKVSMVDLQGAEIGSSVADNFNLAALVMGSDKSVSLSLQIPLNVPVGIYSLMVSIVDSSGNPVISLPLHDRDSQGRYKVGEIAVVDTIDITNCTTWCEGSIFKAPDDSLPLDAQIPYTLVGNNKPSGRLEFTSNQKGTARILDLGDLKLQSDTNTAFIDIPIKCNQSSQTIDLSIVTKGGAAGSWGLITDITDEWQIKRIYLRDLYTYMGTSDYDDIYYLDLYKENGGGVIFWIGDISFGKD